MTLHKKLITFTLCWTMLVIILGAYTRLTDAGLGCPDWPGCYGFLKVPHKAEKMEIAAARFPERPLEHHKAWNEMIHRYLAGTLGLLIGALFVIYWRQQKRLTALPTALLGIVIFQATLGAWTVTMGLLPIVVLAHLLFGFILFSLLAVFWLQQHPSWRNTEQHLRPLLPLAYAALIVVFLQIALGGWTAANYAALACIDLPLCEAGWSSRLAFAEAFDLHLGHDDYEYGVMSQDARATIHVLHRLGAVITFSVVAWFAWRLYRVAQTQLMQRLAQAIALVLLVQFTLGVLNIVLHLPLANAVAHNFVGANLLMLLVIACYQIRKPQGREV
ncbi:COX15/CtaA family protein [Alishewanella tabrizica]|uniref:Cytochrome b561 n=1 Tax=Alishewanella tabrizica TaxID=671278 RepID=A0ABQ2WQN1_9ALTE|nr:COX15/CtaA family protein [Alishewanella tabrizica]GGW68804.1 cytochrome b561 [Alishewanella tabrizica]